jgi:prolyl oligopeptidase
MGLTLRGIRPNKMRSLLALMPIVIADSLLAGSAELAPPPVAPVREVVDDYHGTKVVDSYRYMEDLENPETLAWMKAQSDYAAAALDRLPGRKGLLERIRALDKGAPFAIRDLNRLQNGVIFYRKLSAGAETWVVCSRASVTGEESLILDPKSYETPGGSHASLEFFCPSPDGRLAVSGISKGGSEITTIFIRDLSAGRDLPVSIDRIETAYNSPQWLPDSSGFFYSRRRKLADGTPASETYKDTICYLHRMGHPVEEDTPVFGVGLSKAIAFAPLDFPSIRVTPGSEYVVGQVHHGDSQEVTLYTARLDTPGQKEIRWKKVCDAGDSVTAYEVHGEFIYLITSHGAPRYQVVRTPLERPDFKTAEVVLPESELVLTSVHASKDAVFVNATHNGSGVIVQLDSTRDRKPNRLALPQDLSGAVSDASPHFSEIYISTESWTKGGALYSYDSGDGKFQLSSLQPKGAFDDVPGYTSREVEVPSHDGVLVPLSIIHKEGLAMDGSNPLLLSGYGAYGSIRHVSFSPLNLAWLERGGVLAVAHVRGGGEKGKQWHVSGQKATKPNTWKDFIACAEYLIAQNYTSSAKLAIQGGSAGGVLIGRSITERPDLFRAAIIMVGMTDTLRAETTENGPPNVEEFGSVATRDGFQSLLAMSPLQQVRDGEMYPAVLLTHGLNDRRVAAWMSGKLTARLQAATTSKNPVLLLLDQDAGHGIGSTRTQLQEQLASRLSFVLWQVGAPDFQPRVTPE